MPATDPPAAPGGSAGSAPGAATPRIVDAHQHIGGLGAALGGWRDREETSEQERSRRVAAMGAHGIAWAVIQPAHAYDKTDGIAATRRINDGIAAYRAAAPRHFPRALGTVEPTHGERGLAEIERCHHELGLDGLSWHHRLQGSFIDTPWMRPALRVLADRGMVPFVHVNAESKLEAPWQLVRLALEFPQLSFVALDAFYSYEQTREVLFHAERTPNVVWDLGGPYTPSLWNHVEAAVRALGAERFCFSANLSYAATVGATRPPLLDVILGASLAPEEKRTLLAGSIERVFTGLSAARAG